MSGLEEDLAGGGGSSLPDFFLPQSLDTPPASDFDLEEKLQTEQHHLSYSKRSSQAKNEKRKNDKDFTTGPFKGTRDYH